MSAYKRIVVGTDGSPSATTAVDLAARLSAVEQAELVIVHVQQDDRSEPDLLSKARLRAEKQGANVKTRVEQGDPADRLIAIAEREGADLLVVGNKGMTGVSRFRLGSVPNQVSHHAPCDLLILRTS